MSTGGNSVEDREDAKNKLKKYEFEPKEYYKIVRGEIQHEDELINNRITWLIYLQTILFAAFFLVSTNKPSPSYWKDFERFIFIVGIGSSLHSLAGIIFAAVAVRQLRSGFWKQIKAHRAHPRSYPDPVVNPAINCWGLFLAVLVPCLILLAWAYVWRFLRAPPAFSP